MLNVLHEARAYLLSLGMLLSGVDCRADTQDQSPAAATSASRSQQAEVPAPEAAPIKAEPQTVPDAARAASPEAGQPTPDRGQPDPAAPRTPADSEAPRSGPTQQELARARRHFESALDLYSRGQYRGAIAELELSRKYDPEGKDLIYNLALVHEKLGELSTALGYFRLYLQMEDDENERARTEASIVRLEGALKEVAEPSSAVPAASLVTGPTYPVALHLPPGRLDGWVWGAGGVALAATLVGAVLGSKALATQPGEADATGGGRSARDFRRDAHRAREYAVAADVSLGIGVLGAAAATFLYFGRAAEPVREDADEDRASELELVASPGAVLGRDGFTVGGGLRF